MENINEKTAAAEAQENEIHEIVLPEEIEPKSGENEEIRRMNVLLLGNSGAGKSTLIEAVSGVEIQDGSTPQIGFYESETWPIRFIDTKGYEYNPIEQMKTISQVKKYAREQLAGDVQEQSERSGVDAVWYCVDGPSRRFKNYSMVILNRTIANWKNVPLFVVVTKSFSKSDAAENVAELREIFGKNEKLNVKEIIPVLAKPYTVNDDTIVEPYGIEELCKATLECSEEAYKISVDTKNRMILEQKRFTANALTAGAAAAGVAVGAAPTGGLADSAILVPLEIGLTKGIFKIYGVEFSSDLVTAVVGSTAITKVARMAVSTLKTIPNVAGSIINAVVAGFFVTALGEAVIALSESMYSGKIDKDKIDSAVDFVTDKLKNNPVLAGAISYIEKNADKFKGKSAKEVYESVEKAVKEGKKGSKK